MTNTPPDTPGPPGYSQQPATRSNIVGLIALIVAIIGFVFACIPGTLIIGWILLPIAFILGIIGVVLSGKKKRTSIAAIIVAMVGTIISVIIFLAVVGGALFEASNTDESPGSAQIDEGTHSEASDRAADDADQGTRDHPFQVGEQASTDNWTLTLGDPYEANDVVTDESEANDQPEEGSEFWIVPVEARYRGTDTSFPWHDVDLNVDVKFVGDDGHTYESPCGA